MRNLLAGLWRLLRSLPSRGRAATHSDQQAHSNHESHQPYLDELAGEERLLRERQRRLERLLELHELHAGKGRRP